MKIAIYARVSTDDKGQDPLNQLTQLRAFAASQGWTVVKEYVDHVSAKTGDRPAFKEMWADAEQHRWECLTFWALDRFSREGPLPTLQYLQRLTDLGVRFKSYSESYIDSLGVFGPAIIALLAALAQQERIRLSERTKAGLERARAQGKIIGRPPVNVDISVARQRMAAGLSLRKTAAELGCSAAWLCKRLQSDITGHTA